MDKKNGTQELKYKFLVEFIGEKYKELEKVFKESNLDMAIGDLIFQFGFDGIYEDKFLKDKEAIMKFSEIMICLYINLKGEAATYKLNAKNNKTEANKYKEINKINEEKNKQLLKEIAILKKQIKK